MDYPITIMIALSGAAALGFISAWTYQALMLNKLRSEIKELNAEINDQKIAFNRLKTENETLSTSSENMYVLLQDIENQLDVAKSSLDGLTAQHENLQQSHQSLLDNPVEKVREIEVIREVPVIIYRERDPLESKREKAKKLVKAFKKGFLHETVKAPPSGGYAQ